ncbi:unnamed protein product [Arabis nemorensis]|uniref:Bacterial surface antigen (D15) domain-containing protein n=1 Tax=Arabis nemorensis TaxID=586526 RepID=A0A565BTE6_9BRAS|nr:unnamed protein product [Arabis nemorensis]
MEALRNIKSNIKVIPHLDEKNEGCIVANVTLVEADQKPALVSTEWCLVPGRGRYPSKALFQSAGSVTFKHRNIQGLNQSLIGSGDLLFQLDYVHSHLDDVKNPRNRSFKTSFVNSRKLSPIFTGGPGFEEVVPPMLVDRLGLQANITENLTRQSKFTYGLAFEEITTRDKNGQISANGLMLLPYGGTSVNGPPTTLSGTGIDRSTSQHNQCHSLSTSQHNPRQHQVDQGLGIGSNFPLYNRHQLTLTRFIPLKKVEEGSGNRQPPVLVLHGYYGGCIGDFPSYDAFVLGGPNSVRGYTMGELGAAKHILENTCEEHTCMHLLSMETIWEAQWTLKGIRQRFTGERDMVHPVVSV